MWRCLLAFSVIFLAATTASADTRFGTAIVGGTTPLDTPRGVAGTQVSVSHWVGRFGLAGEGSVMALIDTGREGGATAGIAARALIGHLSTTYTTFSGTRSPLALGLEIEALGQREWWDLEDDS